MGSIFDKVKRKAVLKRAGDYRFRVRYALKHQSCRRAVFVLVTSWSVVLALAAVFWAPAWASRAYLDWKINRERKEVVAVVNAMRLNISYKKAWEKVRHVDDKLGHMASPSGLVWDITALAAKSGLKTSVDSVKRAENAPPGYSLFTQDVTTVGKYRSLRKFLLGFEDLPSLTVVQRMRVDKLEDGGGLVKASLRLATYLRESAGTVESEMEI